MSLISHGKNSEFCDRGSHIFLEMIGGFDIKLFIISSLF